MIDITHRLRTRNGRPDGFGIGPVCDEAADVIEALRAQVTKLTHNAQLYKDALWKACGDDEEAVNATIESQGALR